MARWKARVRFIFAIIELFSLALTVEALQDKTCQDYQEGVGQFEPRFQKEGAVPGQYFCTVLHAVVLTQYRRVTDRRTDGQTDGIAVASTALGMRALRRALRRAVKTDAGVSKI